MEPNQIAMELNSLTEKAKRNKERFVHRKNNIEYDTNISLGKTNIEKDLNYLAVNVLKNQVVPDGFKIGKTQTSMDAKVFIKDGVLKYRSYRQREFHEVVWRASGDYFPGTDQRSVIEIFPKDFQKMLFEITEIRNDYRRYLDDNFQEELLGFEEKTNITIYNKEWSEFSLWYRENIGKVLGFYEVKPGGSPSFKIRLVCVNLNDSAVDFSEPLFFWTNDELREIYKRGLDELESIANMVVNTRKQTEKEIYNVIKKYGYDKILMAKEI